ncbi:predicted protein [Nematostella vectensis]|uniref:Uncharacterized protein n=2 Tax=Nematostella vectensis TaxID=45351 RepID=A7SPQ2_NEMVE|nr:predicted protein [Nematostella vectensis]|eukprot:XP_001626394.1 predicted protein [Nematostella vectensis]
MSMSTSYRYEIERPSAKSLRKALKRQDQRIKNDQWNSERESTVKEDIKVNLIADWSEKLEETSQRRNVKRWHDETKSELSLANQELAAVRRAQLRKLLMEEEAMYKCELNAQEKAFYIKRT